VFCRCCNGCLSVTAFIYKYTYTYIIDVRITNYRCVIVTWEKVHKTLLYIMYVQSSGRLCMYMSRSIGRKRSRTKGTKREILLLVLSSKPLTGIYITLIIKYIYVYMRLVYILGDLMSPQMSENTPTCSSAFLCSKKPPAAGLPLHLSNGTLYFSRIKHYYAIITLTKKNTKSGGGIE